MAGEKNKKPIYKRWWFWLIIIIVIVSIGTSGGNKTKETSQGVTDSKDELLITKVGQTVSTSDFKVTVDAVNKSNGSTYNEPSSGCEFVQVVLTIENLSNKEYSVSSMLMFDAYYDGYATNESISAQINDNSISTMDGTIASGKKLKGQLAYELPTTWQELEIDIDLTSMSFSTSGELKIKLQNQ